MGKIMQVTPITTKLLNKPYFLFHLLILILTWQNAFSQEELESHFVGAWTSSPYKSMILKNNKYSIQLNSINSLQIVGDYVVKNDTLILLGNASQISEIDTLYNIEGCKYSIKSQEDSEVFFLLRKEFFSNGNLKRDCLWRIEREKIINVKMDKKSNETVTTQLFYAKHGPWTVFDSNQDLISCIFYYEGKCTGSTYYSDHESELEDFALNFKNDSVNYEDIGRIKFGEKRIVIKIWR